MNSFGEKFRVSIFGESHGSHLGAIIDGCPCGISLDLGDFAKDLQRRKAGKIGTTKRTENDKPIIISGVYNNYSTGAPITIVFENSNVVSGDYKKLEQNFRPGHADFCAHHKYKGYNDPRGGGHFSGRLTLGIVAAGIIAKKMLPGLKIEAEIIEVGGEKDVEAFFRKKDKDKDKNSYGGIIECRVTNVPIGLGEPFFDSVESVLSHLLFSIPGIKGVEFGSGFGIAKMCGSETNDLYLNSSGKTKTNHSGGVLGGITSGQPLVFRVAVKPTSSIGLEQKTFDFTKQEMGVLSVGGRHDMAFVLRLPPVIEACAAIVLADFTLLRI